MLLANFNRKEHLRHRAVSLRQHGFLVIVRDDLPERFSISIGSKIFAGTAFRRVPALLHP